MDLVGSHHLQMLREALIRVLGAGVAGLVLAGVGWGQVTERVDVDSNGAEGMGGGDLPWPSSSVVSADGRYVAFMSSSILAPGDTNANWDVYLRDRQNGTTELVSVDSSGAVGNGFSGLFGICISPDGRFVAFESRASNLVPGDTNGARDVFLRDRLNGTTERVCVGAGGTQGNGESLYPSLSADARYVAFTSQATNLVPGDTNVADDVFVRDRRSGTTERVSVSTGGGQGDSNSSDAAISADGRYVAFMSLASNLVAGPNGVHILVRDRLNGTTERVSVPTDGSLTTGDDSDVPAISPGGRYVAFRSYSSNLVPGDTNGTGDVFLHDRDATGFTSLCDPGVGGMLACPCSNPPSGSDRGCDNSSSTGGASLSATGIAYLSMDSLLFTTSGEPPTAFSIVMQGNAFLANGVEYGQK